MTKKPETDYDVAAAVPCCKNEENSPRKAGCPSIEKVVVMLLQEAQTGLLAPIPAEAQQKQQQATHPPVFNFSPLTVFSNVSSNAFLHCDTVCIFKSGNPATTPDFSTYPRTWNPAAAPIYCAGNYGLFMPGCISYLPPGDIFSYQEAPGDIFSEGEVFQRLADVYNQLDHPQSTSSYPQKGTTEKIFLDFVPDDEQT